MYIEQKIYFHRNIQKAMQNQFDLTGSAADEILKGINNYLMILAKEQIRLAFEQAEKEVQDLRQRTKEGIVTARLNGKQIGIARNTYYKYKKEVSEELIQEQK